MATNKILTMVILVSLHPVFSQYIHLVLLHPQKIRMLQSSSELIRRDYQKYSHPQIVPPENNPEMWIVVPETWYLVLSVPHMIEYSYWNSNELNPYYHYTEIGIKINSVDYLSPYLFNRTSSIYIKCKHLQQNVTNN